ncbi:MAG: YvcK family protein [Candidatus Wallbacteria bacterium]
MNRSNRHIDINEQKKIIKKYDMFKWLLFGIGIKRWLALGTMLSVSLGFFIFAYFMNFKVISNVHILALCLVVNIVLIIFIFIKILIFIDNITSIAKEGHLDDYFIDIKPDSYVPKIAIIGGGTGLSTLLRGIREYGNIDSSKNLSAIVTVGDNGGSSGKLREEMNMLPPGDIRNCLTALSTEEALLTKLFQYRFKEGSLSGHSFGNLFIAAMTNITGDFVKAIKESSKILAVSGKVFPSTVTPLELKAIYEDGTHVTGESQISLNTGKKIRKIELIPEHVEALPEAVNEIEKADAIVIGPGSLFTSLVPNLLIRDIKNAIINSGAIKIYVCNVMTQPGETDGFTASDHLKAINSALGQKVIDYIIISDVENVDPELLERYKQKKAYPVKIDIENLAVQGARIVRENISSYSNFLRHDPPKLSKCLLNIIKNSRHLN